MRLKTKFQDEDFDLGEVVEANIYHGGDGKIKVVAEPAKGGIITFYLKTLKELNELFEDAPEEPKEYWAIDCFVPDGDLVSQFSNCSESVIENRKSIGNYFETREEAEKTVRKLKALKRLKDKGFRFDGWDDGAWRSGKRIMHFRITSLDEDGDCLPHFVDDDTANDLDLLFGGEK